MNPKNRGRSVQWSSDPDIISGSLPYLESVFTKLQLLLIQCNSSEARLVVHAFLIRHM